LTTLPPKRRTTKKRVWPYVLLGTIFIFVLAAVAGAFFAQSSLLDRAKTDHKEELLVAKDKATIMIMGVDEREGDVGRSDTLMVVTMTADTRLIMWLGGRLPAPAGRTISGGKPLASSSLRAPSTEAASREMGTQVSVEMARAPGRICRPAK